jgi:hypothetical protein
MNRETRHIGRLPVDWERPGQLLGREREGRACIPLRKTKD